MIKLYYTNTHWYDNTSIYALKARNAGLLQTKAHISVLILILRGLGTYGGCYKDR